ncbi:MAG TPA: DUF2760 domain-containing protein [Polyangia bacterium]
MSRIVLAFACFFSVLFRGRLPPRALQLLPEEFLHTPTPPPRLNEAPAPAAAPVPVPAMPSGGYAPPGPSGTFSAVGAAGATATSASMPRFATPARGADAAEHRSEGALLVLGLLQREGRLVDFLRESLDQHPDAAIGAAVRDIHRGCKKVLEEQFRLEPVMPGREEGPVVVPRGFDPSEVRLIGKAAGDPPFRGILVHHGWRAVDVKLPTLSDGVDRRVLAPAEVRLG